MNEQPVVRDLLRQCSCVLPLTVGVALLVTASVAWIACSSPSKPTPQPASPASGSNAPSQNTNPETSATPLIGSLTGSAPPFTPVDNTWQSFQVSTAANIGGLKYPPGWWANADTASGVVNFYPPTSDPTHPSPTITVAYLVDTPFASYQPPAATTSRQPVNVSGMTGWEVEDTGQLGPLNRYVAAPYRNGTLVITAYKGPGVDLTPFLEAMLPTIQLAP